MKYELQIGGLENPIISNINFQYLKHKIILPTEENSLPSWEINPKCRNCPTDIYYDDDVAWLFGMYAADGGSELNHKICITLNKHEQDLADRCCLALKKLGLNPRIKQYPTFMRVYVDSAIVANSFYNWFGKKQDKHLPSWLFNDKWNLEQVLQGVLDGDGCIIKKTRKRIVNTSKMLIYQCRDIILILGLCPFVNLHKIKTSYCYPNAKPAYILEWSQRSMFNYIKDGYYYMKVKHSEVISTKEI